MTQNFEMRFEMKYFAAHTDALQRHQVYFTAVSTSFQTWNTRGVFVGCAHQKYFCFSAKVPY